MILFNLSKKTDVFQWLRAAAGAAIGFAATKSSYVAAGCAVVAGAVSSEEGFRQDCVCIIIPL